MNLFLKNKLLLVSLVGLSILSSCKKSDSLVSNNTAASTDSVKLCTVMPPPDVTRNSPTTINGVIVNSVRWGAGQTIRVKFLN
jgi:hypothetical protein